MKRKRERERQKNIDKQAGQIDKIEPNTEGGKINRQSDRKADRAVRPAEQADSLTILQPNCSRVTLGRRRTA